MTLPPSLALSMGSVPAGPSTHGNVLHQRCQLTPGHLQTLLLRGVSGITCCSMSKDEHGLQGMGVRGDREYVRTAVEGSLKRLNIEQIDLYYQHRVDRNVQIEETWSELKVRHAWELCFNHEACGTLMTRSHCCHQGVCTAHQSVPCELLWQLHTLLLKLATYLMHVTTQLPALPPRQGSDAGAGEGGQGEVPGHLRGLG